jgi:hypothetical protein
MARMALSAATMAAVPPAGGAPGSTRPVDATSVRARRSAYAVAGELVLETSIPQGLRRAATTGRPRRAIS